MKNETKDKRKLGKKLYSLYNIYFIALESVLNLVHCKIYINILIVGRYARADIF